MRPDIGCQSLEAGLNHKRSGDMLCQAQAVRLRATSRSGHIVG
jgi:hypothetical protein